MRFNFISLFPEIINAYLSCGVVGRAVEQRVVEYWCFNPRDYTKLKHGQVDDRPYGGGAGMVLRADVLRDTLIQIPSYQESLVLVTAANGSMFRQDDARELSSLGRDITVVCGRYEGVDQRFIDKYGQRVYAIGKYVLSGGELAALVIADSIIRLMPGVLGNELSSVDESYGQDESYREYAQYTRPEVFEEMSVPEVLRSGNHRQIQKWRDEYDVAT